MRSAWRASVLLLAGLPLTLAAEPVSSSNEKAAPRAERRETPRADEKSESQVRRLAARYGVPAPQVEDLRRQKLGWGEINAALAIAKRSGQPLSAIMALHASGLGWGEIAQKYGFKLGDAVGRADGHDRSRTRARERERERGEERGERPERDRAPEFGPGPRGRR
ncbi:MAG: hypothetical protein KGM24_07840 [Elusimicrobia bacterium]|nr:hypothetical protein [Elusimicrobiota bacterium]